MELTGLPVIQCSWLLELYISPTWIVLKTHMHKLIKIPFFKTVSSASHTRPQLCHSEWSWKNKKKKEPTRSFVVQPYSSSSSSSAALCHQHFICWCCACHSWAGGGARNAAAKKLFATPPTLITRSVFPLLKGPPVCQDALRTLRNSCTGALQRAPFCSLWKRTGTFGIKIVERHIPTD